MVELAGHELKIRLETRLHALNQLFRLEPMRVLRGDAYALGIDRSVLLARKMFGGIGGQAING